MRKKFIAGNWKMYTNGAGAETLAAAVVKGLGNESRVRVAVCPPFPFLSRVGQALRGSSVVLGAQNLYPEKEGAFTGEVSPLMLVDAGCKLAIVGHSERRQKFGETDAFINKKVHAGLAAGLEIILCIGETLQEREGNLTEKVLDTQLTGCLTNITGESLARITLAYEPVWAIGTGKNATPQQAQDAHAFIRKRVAQLCGTGPAQALIIQYGGSVKPDNAGVLLSQPDVDGALVGGASLQADAFLSIVRAGIGG
jgi:triosephosphate isomerase